MWVGGWDVRGDHKEANVPHLANMEWIFLGQEIIYDTTWNMCVVLVKSFECDIKLGGKHS